MKTAVENLFEKQRMARGNIFLNPLLVSLVTAGNPNSSKFIIGLYVENN